MLNLKLTYQKEYGCKNLELALKFIKIFLGLLVFTFFVNSSKIYAQSTGKYTRDLNVGATEFDPQLDDPSFKPCYSQLDYNFGIPEYYQVETKYKEGNKSIRQYFKENFKSKPEFLGEFGYLTIRFIVNCEGKTGWFRFLETDLNFQKKTFKQELKSEILEKVKLMKGWHSNPIEGQVLDSYFYITLKFENGLITDVIP